MWFKLGLVVSFVGILLASWEVAAAGVLLCVAAVWRIE